MEWFVEAGSVTEVSLCGGRWHISSGSNWEEAKLRLPIIKLTVRVSNQGAITMYEKMGYRTIDIWRGYYNDGEDGLVMTKKVLL